MTKMMTPVPEVNFIFNRLLDYNPGQSTGGYEQQTYQAPPKEEEEYNPQPTHDDYGYKPNYGGEEEETYKTSYDTYQP